MTKKKGDAGAEKKRLAALEQTARDQLSQPYARILVPEADGSYRGEIMEFPGCISAGDTANEALGNLEDVAASWLMGAYERAQPIPEPVEGSVNFSGKLMLRLPKSLHKKASWYASREGVSLNQFIVYCVSECVGERRQSRAAGDA